MRNLLLLMSGLTSLPPTPLIFELLLKEGKKWLVRVAVDERRKIPFSLLVYMYNLFRFEN